MLERQGGEVEDDAEEGALMSWESCRQRSTRFNVPARIVLPAGQVVLDDLAELGGNSLSGFLERHTPKTALFLRLRRDRPDRFSRRRSTRVAERGERKRSVTDNGVSSRELSRYATPVTWLH